MRRHVRRLEDQLTGRDTEIRSLARLVSELSERVEKQQHQLAVALDPGSRDA